MSGFDIEKFLYIDDLWGISGIEKKLQKLKAMRQYANDWTVRIKSIIDILEERKRPLK